MRRGACEVHVAMCRLNAADPAQGCRNTPCARSPRQRLTCPEARFIIRPRNPASLNRSAIHPRRLGHTKGTCSHAPENLACASRFDALANRTSWERTPWRPLHLLDAEQHRDPAIAIVIPADAGKFCVGSHRRRTTSERRVGLTGSPRQRWIVVFKLGDLDEAPPVRSDKAVTLQHDQRMLRMICSVRFTVAAAHHHRQH